MPTSAFPPLHPSTQDLHRCFRETLETIGDVSISAHNHGETLFARAVLPDRREVRPGDHLCRGVALRTSGTEVLIHPYTLREVCTNGAVRAHATHTRIVQRVAIDEVVTSANSYTVEAKCAEIGAAVRESASLAAFAQGVEEMRSALDVDAAQALERLHMSELLSKLPSTRLGMHLHRLLSRRTRELTLATSRDRSAFAFGNALTAAGRDAPNPAIRWVLEEYGAAVFAASLLTEAPPQATLPPLTARR